MLHDDIYFNMWFYQMIQFVQQCFLYLGKIRMLQIAQFYVQQDTLFNKLNLLIVQIVPVQCIKYFYIQHFRDIIKVTCYTIFVNKLFHILLASVSCLLHFTWPYQFHPCTFPPKAKWKVNKIWTEQIYVLYNKYVMLFIEIQNVCCEFAVKFYLLDHISFSPLHYTPKQNKTIKKLHRWQTLLLLI